MKEQKCLRNLQKFFSRTQQWNLDYETFLSTALSLERVRREKPNRADLWETYTVYQTSPRVLLFSYETFLSSVQYLERLRCCAWGKILCRFRRHSFIRTFDILSHLQAFPHLLNLFGSSGKFLFLESSEAPSFLQGMFWLEESERERETEKEKFLWSAKRNWRESTNLLSSSLYMH